MMRVLALAIVLAGCHPYLAGGYQLSPRVSGPLAQMTAQPVITARQTQPTAAPAPAPAGTPHTYSLAVGFGVPDFAVELGVQAHEVTGGSFALPSDSDAYLASPRYLTTTGSFDLRWTWLRGHRMSTYVHVGPAFGCVIDKGDGSAAWGEGVRYGAGIALELPVIRIFADASRTDLELFDGPGQGFNALSGLTLGAALH